MALNIPHCRAIHLAIVIVLVFLNISCTKIASNEEATVIQYGNFKIKSKTLDAGKVFSDDVYDFEFRFQNCSENNIEILKTITSCTCTDAIVEPNLIMPGKEGTLTGKIHFKGKSGKSKEQIAIEASDGKSYIFTVNANVMKHYIVNPPIVEFGDVWWDDTLKATVAIDSQSIQNSSDFLELLPGLHKSIKTEIKSYEKNKWHIDISVTDPPIGNLHQRMIVKTNNYRHPEILIPIKGNVQKPISVKPEALFLGSVSNKQKMSFQLIISRRPGMKTEITEISTKNISIATKKTDFVDDCAKIKLDIDFSNKHGLVKENITIKTSSPQWSLYLPIIAYVEN